MPQSKRAIALDNTPADGSDVDADGFFRAQEAIVVSFCAGDKYYYDAAEALEKRLDGMNVAHDIVRMEIPEGVDWIDICRRKIAFYRDMLIKHKRPVVWLDVDSHIMNRPTSMLRSSADITCFLRYFSYLPKFDPDQYARLFAPAYLCFNYNDRVLDFLNYAVELVEGSDEKATDDYFLQEAVMSWPGDMRIMVMKTSDVSRNPEDPNYGNTYFVHGDSGNVDIFKGVAAQHKRGAFALPRQKAVLREGAQSAVKGGRLEHALAFHRRIFELDSNDSEALGKFTDLMRRQKSWGPLGYHLDKHRENPLHAHVVERVEFLSRLDRGQFDKAEAMFKEAVARDSANVGLMKSRTVRYDLDRRAAAAGIPDDARTPMWWMETPYPGNFGDIINPYVIEGLTGIPPKFANGAGRLIAIGSIIKFAKRGDKVWGAGAPSQNQPINPEAVYHAVRGPLTRDLVLQAGADAPEVYGDAAWFLPRIYAPKIAKTHKLGLILHSVHMEAAPPVDPDVRIIDIRRVGPSEIEAFIDEMLSCEALLSTSLHGVIVAHAYGIPVRWCMASDSPRQIHGDGTKFEDYFQSVGRSAPSPLDLSGLDRIDSGLAALCLDQPERPIDLRALAQAAPFAVRPDLLAAL